MSQAKIDLHMHSAHSSDGDIAPEALVAMAQSAGLAAIAITDHNTTSAVEAAIEAGKKAGVEVLPAVELDCMLDGVVLHLLAYGIDPNDAALAKIDRDIRRQEKAAARERVRLVNAAGINVDEGEALTRARHGVFVTGELIAELALEQPDAAQNPLLRPYLPGGERSDNPHVNFYWDFCAQGKPAYVPVEYISLARAVQVAHGAGGVAVLAHPGQNLAGRRELLADMLPLGLDGVECYSSYHDAATNAYFAQKAKEYGLLVTGGSDYHGKTKPAIRMGQYGLPDDGLELLAALKGALA